MASRLAFAPRPAERARQVLLRKASRDSKLRQDIHSITDPYLPFMVRAFRTALRELSVDPADLAHHIAQGNHAAAIGLFDWDTFRQRLAYEMEGPVHFAVLAAMYAEAERTAKKVPQLTPVKKDERPRLVVLSKLDASSGDVKLTKWKPKPSQYPGGSWYYMSDGPADSGQTYWVFVASGDDPGAVINDALKAQGMAAEEPPPFVVPTDAAYGFDFTTMNQAAYDAAQDQIATLVTQVSGQTQAAIRDAIANGFKEGIPIPQTAEVLSQFVGLSLPQQAALSNWQGGMLDSMQKAWEKDNPGQTWPGPSDQQQAQLNQATADRYQQYQEQRATTIARTETVRASNIGQKALWDTAVANGYLDPKLTRKKWIPASDACPICNALADMGEIAFDDTWGDVDMPPSHPNCRCSVGLVIDQPPATDATAATYEEAVQQAASNLQPPAPPPPQLTSKEKSGQAGFAGAMALDGWQTAQLAFLAEERLLAYQKGEVEWQQLEDEAYVKALELAKSQQWGLLYDNLPTDAVGALAKVVKVKAPKEPSGGWKVGAQVMSPVQPKPTPAGEWKPGHAPGLWQLEAKVPEPPPDPVAGAMEALATGEATELETIGKLYDAGLDPEQIKAELQKWGFASNAVDATEMLAGFDNQKLDQAAYEAVKGFHEGTMTAPDAWAQVLQAAGLDQPKAAQALVDAAGEHQIIDDLKAGGVWIPPGSADEWAQAWKDGEVDAKTFYQALLAEFGQSDAAASGFFLKQYVQHYGDAYVAEGQKELIKEVGVPHDTVIEATHLVGLGPKVEEPPAVEVPLSQVITKDAVLDILKNAILNAEDKQALLVNLGLPDSVAAQVLKRAGQKGPSQGWLVAEKYVKTLPATVPAEAAPAAPAPTATAADVLQGWWDQKYEDVVQMAAAAQFEGIEFADLAAEMEENGFGKASIAEAQAVYTPSAPVPEHAPSDVFMGSYEQKVLAIFQEKLASGLSWEDAQVETMKEPYVKAGALLPSELADLVAKSGIEAGPVAPPEPTHQVTKEYVIGILKQNLLTGEDKLLSLKNLGLPQDVAEKVLKRASQKGPSQGWLIAEKWAKSAGGEAAAPAEIKPTAPSMEAAMAKDMVQALIDMKAGYGTLSDLVQHAKQQGIGAAEVKQALAAKGMTSLMNDIDGLYAGTTFSTPEAEKVAPTMQEWVDGKLSPSQAWSTMQYQLGVGTDPAGDLAALTAAHTVNHDLAPDEFTSLRNTFEMLKAGDPSVGAVPQLAKYADFKDLQDQAAGLKPAGLGYDPSLTLQQNYIKPQFQGFEDTVVAAKAAGVPVGKLLNEAADTSLEVAYTTNIITKVYGPIPTVPVMGKVPAQGLPASHGQVKWTKWKPKPGLYTHGVWIDGGEEVGGKHKWVFQEHGQQAPTVPAAEAKAAVQEPQSPAPPAAVVGLGSATGSIPESYGELTSLKQIAGPHGSQAGQWYADSGGHAFYAKPNDAPHAYNEVASDKAYEALGLKPGVDVPYTAVLKDSSGRTYIVSQRIDGLEGKSGSWWQSGEAATARAEAEKSWGMDTLLAHYDTVGQAFDNLLVTADGLHVVRIEAGGGMAYRAMGGDKASWQVYATAKQAADKLYADVVSMRGGGTAANQQLKAVFGTISDQRAAELLLQAKATLGDLTQLDAKWAASGIPQDVRQANLAVLKQRIDAIDEVAQRLGYKPAAAVPADLPDSGLKSGTVKYTTKHAPNAVPGGGWVSVPSDVEGKRKWVFQRDGEQLQARPGEVPTGVRNVGEVVDGFTQGSIDPLRGSSFAWDARDVEDFDVRVIALQEDGVKGYGLKFKLTADALRDVRASLRKGGWQEQSFQILQKVRGDTGYVVSPQAAWSAAGKTYYLKQPDGTVVRVHMPTAASHAFEGLVEVFVPQAAMGEAKMAELSNLLQVDAHYPTPEDVRALGEQRLLYIFDPKASVSTDPTVRAAALARIKVTWNVSVDDLEMRAGADGRVELRMPKAVADAIVAKYHVQVFTHRLTGSGIEDILLGDQRSLLSTTMRWTEGVGRSGMSSQADIGTGGADYIFTHQMDKYADVRSHTGSILIDASSVLQRMDWYSYTGDRYGRNRDQGYLDRDIRALDTAGGETMFKQRVGWEDIEYIIVDDPVSLIRKLQREGVTDFAGRPLENVIVKPGTMLTPRGGQKYPTIGAVPLKKAPVMDNFNGDGPAAATSLQPNGFEPAVGADWKPGEWSPTGNIVNGMNEWKWQPKAPASVVTSSGASVAVNPSTSSTSYKYFAYTTGPTDVPANLFPPGYGSWSYYKQTPLGAKWIWKDA